MRIEDLLSIAYLWLALFTAIVAGLLTHEALARRIWRDGRHRTGRKWPS